MGHCAVLRALSCSVPVWLPVRPVLCCLHFTACGRRPWEEKEPAQGQGRILAVSCQALPHSLRISAGKRLPWGRVVGGNWPRSGLRALSGALAWGRRGRPLAQGREWWTEGRAGEGTVKLWDGGWRGGLVGRWAGTRLGRHWHTGFHDSGSHGGF